MDGGPFEGQKAGGRTPVGQSGAEDYRFPDTTEGGFIIINAESLEDAAEIAAEAPIIGNGGHILVRQCGEMN